MDAEELEQLFRPFHQLDNGLARSHEGTGLGLAISQRLAALMGGSITVHSTPGLGSTFTLNVPLEEETVS
jgi:signal transduction histidine kinase